jgi:hypothetical protein
VLSLILYILIGGVKRDRKYIGVNKVIVADQYITIKWNSNNVEYYKSKGIKFTHIGEDIQVHISDLPKFSSGEVTIKCDFCGNNYTKPYSLYNRPNRNGNLNTVGDCCSECVDLKFIALNKERILELNCVDTFKKLMNGEINNLPCGFTKHLPEEDLSQIIKICVDKMIEDKLFDKIELTPKYFNQKNLKKYKLITFIGNYDLYYLLNLGFPDRWKPWHLSKVKVNFWSDSENQLCAYNWIIEKIITDNSLNSLDEAVPYFTKEMFKENGLDGLLTSKFNTSPVQFLMHFNPNKWFEWEFKLTPKFFWTKKENRIKAMKQLIENNMKLNIIDIPEKMTYGFLVKNYHKFSSICDQYYKSDLFEWINECYPSTFQKIEFNKCVASDGVKLDSLCEKEIHEYLISNFSDVHYYYNKNTSTKWFNEEEDESYVADWLINGNIIIEYFGWYNMNLYNKHEIYKNYIKKSNRKIIFFESFNDYQFIALFPSDMNRGLRGVIEKIKYITEK